MAGREFESAATQPNEPESIVQPARAWLHFVYPRELAGLSVELSDGLSLGRDPSLSPPHGAKAVAEAGGHFCVLHPTVSRRHALIRNDFGVPYLSDLGSSNGTRVAGKKAVGNTALPLQSVVRLGDTLAIVDEPCVDASNDAPSALPGRSARMARLRSLLARAAPQVSPVLILGETGTGKERLAADIHRASGRRGPYLKLSCAELSPQLIESQLFGHERGAFTGAENRHSGLFVAAHLGSLFLDEIGELPLESQAKLLRVIQEHEVRPVGSTRTQQVDVRIITATNRDLEQEVANGKFRRDLLARLSVFELKLPSLRERRQDILSWLDRLSERSGRRQSSPHWQPFVAERVLLHDWPDNLRGLDRLVQRILSIGEGVTVGMQLLRESMPELCENAELDPPEPIRTTPPARDPGTPSLDQAKAVPATPTRDEFLTIYEAMDRNIRAISMHFGRDRRQIYRWLELFGIQR